MYYLTWKYEANQKFGQVVGDPDSLSTIYWEMKGAARGRVTFQLFQLCNGCISEIEENGKNVPWFHR